MGHPLRKAKASEFWLCFRWPLRSSCEMFSVLSNSAVAQVRFSLSNLKQQLIEAFKANQKTEDSGLAAQHCHSVLDY